MKIRPNQNAAQASAAQDIADASKQNAPNAAQALPPEPELRPGKYGEGVDQALPVNELEAQRQKIVQRCELACAYARAGKHELAKRRWLNARERLEKLVDKATEIEPGPSDVHPALWTQSAKLSQTERLDAAQSAVSSAKSTIDSLREVVAVSESTDAPKKTVLIFGLSANPPTGVGGHAGIVSWGATQLKVDVPNDEEPQKAFENVAVDEVWVIPVYRHAFASKSNLLPFEDRMAMAKLAFEQLPELEGRVHVKDAERSLADAAYAKAEADGRAPQTVKLGSIDLIEMLQAEHPEIQFALAFGGDTYRDYTKGLWKGGRELEERVPLVVIPRKGVDGVDGSEDNAPQLSDISSTKVRASTDLAFLSEALHPKVLEYMQANKLYGFADKEEGSKS